jgi:hypothetical protein
MKNEKKKQMTIPPKQTPNQAGRIFNICGNYILSIRLGRFARRCLAIFQPQYARQCPANPTCP